jgi:hypothetical protein
MQPYEAPLALQNIIIFIKTGYVPFFRLIFDQNDAGIFEYIANLRIQVRENRFTVLEYVVATGEAGLFLYLLEQNAITKFNQDIERLKIAVCKTSSNEIDMIFSRYCRDNNIDPDNCDLPELYDAQSFCRCQ